MLVSTISWRWQWTLRYYIYKTYENIKLLDKEWINHKLFNDNINNKALAAGNDVRGLKCSVESEVQRKGGCSILHIELTSFIEHLQGFPVKLLHNRSPFYPWPG